MSKHRLRGGDGSGSDEFNKRVITERAELSFPSTGR